MPRGQPDFGAYAAQTYTAGLADMAELAVRLGSISIFDRRGTVIDLDDFEGALFKWRPVNAGAAYSRFSSESAKSGTQSVIMHVGAAADWQTYIGRGVTLLASKRIGIEVSYAAPATTASFEIQLLCADGVDLYYAQIQLDFDALKCYYRDKDGEWQEIFDLSPPDTWEFIYCPVKLVVDFDTKKYVRFLFGGVEYDLSAYDLWDGGAGLTPHIITYLYWTRIAGVDSDIYVDDYILTMDEP